MEHLIVSPETRLMGQTPRGALDCPRDTLDGWARHHFHELWVLKRLDFLPRHYAADAVLHAGGRSGRKRYPQHRAAYRSTFRLRCPMACFASITSATPKRPTA